MTEYTLLAAAGGLLYDVFEFLEIKNIPKDKRPDFHDFWFWLPLVVYPFLGMLFGYLYEDSGVEMNRLLAVQVGLSAPLIIKQLTKSNPFSRALK